MTSAMIEYCILKTIALGYIDPEHDEQRDVLIRPNDAPIGFDGRAIFFRRRDGRWLESITVNHALEEWLKNGSIAQIGAKPAAQPSVLVGQAIVVSCTCGTWQVEIGATPPRCPRCNAPERYPTRATDYVASPWEELDARRRMYGVFHGEGESADPIAIFRTEDQAVKWLAWQESLGDEGELGNVDYTIAAVDQLDGVVWNSYKSPPP